MVGYGVLGSAARPGRAAHNTAPNAKVANVIFLTIVRLIDFSLRCGLQYSLATYDD